MNNSRLSSVETKNENKEKPPLERIPDTIRLIKTFLESNRGTLWKSPQRLFVDPSNKVSKELEEALFKDATYLLNLLKEERHESIQQFLKTFYEQLESAKIDPSSRTDFDSMSVLKSYLFAIPSAFSNTTKDTTAINLRFFALLQLNINYYLGLSTHPIFEQTLLQLESKLLNLSEKDSSFSYDEARRLMTLVKTSKTAIKEALEAAQRSTEKETLETLKNLITTEHPSAKDICKEIFSPSKSENKQDDVDTRHKREEDSDKENLNQQNANSSENKKIGLEIKETPKMNHSEKQDLPCEETEDQEYLVKNFNYNKDTNCYYLINSNDLSSSYKEPSGLNEDLHSHKPPPPYYKNFLSCLQGDPIKAQNYYAQYDPKTAFEKKATDVVESLTKKVLDFNTLKQHLILFLDYAIVRNGFKEDPSRIRNLSIGSLFGKKSKDNHTDDNSHMQKRLELTAALWDSRKEIIGSQSFVEIFFAVNDLLNKKEFKAKFEKKFAFKHLVEIEKIQFSHERELYAFDTSSERELYAFDTSSTEKFMESVSNKSKSLSGNEYPLVSLALTKVINPKNNNYDEMMSTLSDGDKNLFKKIHATLDLQYQKAQKNDKKALKNNNITPPRPK